MIGCLHLCHVGCRLYSYGLVFREARAAVKPSLNMIHSQCRKNTYHPRTLVNDGNIVQTLVVPLMVIMVPIPDLCDRSHRRLPRNIAAVAKGLPPNQLFENRITRIIPNPHQTRELFEEGFSRGATF
jgi:hypothetical protein